MLNILAQSMQGDASQLGMAAVEALIGFVIVLIGIGVLIFIIWLCSVIIEKIALKKKPAKTEKKSAPVANKTPEKVAPVSEEIPDEVKAAIMAAIMAYYSAEKPKAEFVVKRIKRI